MLSPGDKLKDYEVIAPLTSGGMATLFLARRRGVGGFSRLVALKLVHQHLTEDSAMIKLFLDEARISAHVVHPNVVHVEEVGMEGGIYFIAMEYVHGVSLAQLLKRLSDEKRRLSPKLCVWLAAQVAEALHAAHEAIGETGPLHIVHRDVSPQNVLIGHTGHAKLIDFGIAKSQAALHQSAGGAAVLGKLRYMSPEQLHLEPVDRRTDVYALGVMLWEMLTSRSLLRCQRIDDPRDWAIRENPPPPSKYTPLSTSQLDRVVLKAIAHDKTDRYDNALQFRSALLRAEPSAARIDAPKIAAVLRAVLADELDRQRANLPNEVTVQLDMGADAQPEPKESSLAEFTTHIGNASLEVGVEDNDSEPTRIKSSPSSPRITLEPPAAYTPTLSTPALSPEAARVIAKMRRTASMGVVTVGAVCLAIGLLIGRGTSSPTPSSEPLILPPTNIPGERVTAPQVSPDVSDHAALTTKPTVTSLTTSTARAEAPPTPPPQAAAPAPAPALVREEPSPDDVAPAEEPPAPAVKPAPVAKAAKVPVRPAKPVPVAKRKFAKKRVVSSSGRKPY